MVSNVSSISHLITDITSGTGQTFGFIEPTNGKFIVKDNSSFDISKSNTKIDNNLFKEYNFRNSLEITSNSQNSINDMHNLMSFIKNNYITIKNIRNVKRYLLEHYDLDFLLRKIVYEAVQARKEKVICSTVIDYIKDINEHYISVVFQSKEYSNFFFEFVSELTNKFADSVHKSSGYILIDYQFLD